MSDCRQLRVDLAVLSRDYGETCSTSRWHILAVVAVFGIITISIGVPVGMFVWMRRVMKSKMQAVRLKGDKRGIAYRDFDRKFNFMAGEFRPEA